MPFSCVNFITINAQQGISQFHDFLRNRCPVVGQLLMQEVFSMADFQQLLYRLIAEPQ